MFDPAAEAIFRERGPQMRAVAQHAPALGFALFPNDKSTYVRLVLSPRKGSPVTVYLHGNRLAVTAKALQGFAAALPGCRRRLKTDPLAQRFAALRNAVHSLASGAHHDDAVTADFRYGRQDASAIIACVAALLQRH
jgi:hypothetical protein